MLKQTRFRFAVLVVALVNSNSLAIAADFRGLGDLRGGRFHSIPVGVSADGNTVAGRGIASEGVVAFRWRRDTGIERFTDQAQPARIGQVLALSSNGSVIFGMGEHSFRPRAFRFTSAEGLIWLDESSTHQRFSVAYGASADGSVAVGRVATGHRFEAFRWTAVDGIVGLGDLPGGDFHSVAFGTSADGNIVVGKARSANGPEAFLWTDQETMIGLGDLPGGHWQSEARAVSADGTVVVGQSSSAAGLQAFRWNRAEGMVGLGDLPGGHFESTALAVSADGSVVVGTAHSDAGVEAFIWTAADGMQSLRNVLYQMGADVAGWELLEATGISHDGTVVIGYGENISGRTEAWRADLDSQTMSGHTQPRLGAVGIARHSIVGPTAAIALTAVLVAWRLVRRVAGPARQRLSRTGPQIHSAASDVGKSPRRDVRVAAATGPSVAVRATPSRLRESPVAIKCT